MNQANMQAPVQPPRRRRRIGRTIRRVLGLLLVIALVFVVVRYWPYIYNRFFGGDTLYVSERFSEVVKDQNRMEVLSDTITGQETATMEAAIIGTVQSVTIPYTFTIGFFVDYDQAVIGAKGNTVTIAIPEPYADYYKLTVDEANVKKSDFLVPLTSERSASIRLEIERKLFEECSTKPEYLERAWNSNVENLKKLFNSLLNSINTNENGLTRNYQIEVTKMPKIAPTESASLAPETTAAIDQ